MIHFRLKNFLAATPTALAVGLFALAATFSVGVHPVFATPAFSNGDVHVNVKDELSQNVVGGLVGFACPGGGLTAIAYTDGGGNISAVAGTFPSADCQDGETITISVYKPGFITNTSFTATYHADADNGTYNVTDFKYALKTIALKSEVGGTITNLENGSSADGNPSPDVTIVPISGVTIYSSRVVDDVIYIAATATGEGDSLSIQLQNASADGGGANVATFVKKTLDVTSISGAGSQKTVDIENEAAGGDINTATGFNYPLSVQVADQLGNGIDISALTSPSPNLGGFGYYTTNGSNKMYFSRVATSQNLNISYSGYRNVTATNSGLLGVNGGVSTSQNIATHILMGPADPNTAGIEAGQGGDIGVAVKGLEFAAYIPLITEELGTELGTINLGQAITVKTGDDFAVSCITSAGGWYCPLPLGQSTGIQVKKAGFITNMAFSFAGRSQDSDAQDSTMVSNVLYAMKVTQIQNEAYEDVMPTSGTPFTFEPFLSNGSNCDITGMIIGGGESICQGTYFYSQTYHDFGEGNKAWYFAVDDTDTGASYLDISIPNYINYQSPGDIYPDPSSSSQETITLTPNYVSANWQEPAIAFPLKVSLRDELDNPITYRNATMTYNGVPAHHDTYMNGQDYFFLNTETSYGISVSLDGYVDLDLAVDNGLTNITTNTTVQTHINLGGTTPFTMFVMPGDTVTGSGLKHGLKVNVVQEGDNAPVTSGSYVAVHHSSGEEALYPAFDGPGVSGCVNNEIDNVYYCETRISGIEGQINNIRVVNGHYSTKYVPFTNRAASTTAQQTITAILGIPTDRDLTAPLVYSSSPIADATNVATSVHPYVNFSEPLDPKTVNGSSVALCQTNGMGSCYTIDANIVLANGGMRAIITPDHALSENTLYMVRVLTSVKDLAGNNFNAEGWQDLGVFSTGATSLQVTQITTVANSNGTTGTALANDTYEDGFAWVFHITAPSNEDTIQLKFSDFTSGLNSLAATNIRYCSNQAQSGSKCSDSSEGSYQVITTANEYATGIFFNDNDLDLATPGRQVEIRVEMKVPETTVAGSYSGSYGVHSAATLG